MTLGFDQDRRKKQIAASGREWANQSGPLPPSNLHPRTILTDSF